MTRPRFCRRHWLIRPSLIIAFSVLTASSASVAAERAIEVELRPAGDPQIAVWLEDASGAFVDTIMVTRLVGTFGLGNRPGRFDFGGGYLWPYGRREMALPVWAHRRGVEYDRLVFQDCRESSLGWHETHSSMEPFYCRPVTSSEMSVDTITCPTTAFNTDKGIALRLIDPARSPDCRALSGSLLTSYYPPRNDVASIDRAHDWNGVGTYNQINDLDVVTRATPPTGEVYRVTYQIPAAVAPGRYFVWVEVNLEYDVNAHHAYDFFVDPQLRDYGIETIGQPSVLWRLPLEIGGSLTTSQTKDYVGYGSPDGQDGDLRDPDGTITEDRPGSGAGRLLLLSNAEGDYRVRVSFNPDAPCAEPLPVEGVRLVASDYHYVDVGFVASASASSYEVRYREGKGTIRTEDDFVGAVPGPAIQPAPPGTLQSIRVEQLRPKTSYTVAVRSYDHCRQASALATIEVTTDERIFATVDACFIATAAYGSLDAREVVALRRFRDRVLMRSEIGRWVVDLYYAASPPLAAIIRDNETLRGMVRSMLGPAVSIAESVE